MLRTFATEETGQTIIEYALIVTFIMMAVVGLAAGYHQSMAGVTQMSDQNLANAAVIAQ